MFSIADSEDLAVFEDFFFNNSQAIRWNEYLGLECSCKISGDQIFPERFYLSQKVSWEHQRGHQREKMNRLAQFFQEYSAQQGMVLDQNQLHRMIGKLETFNITRFGFAIDIREMRKDSRVKLGAIIRGSHERINRFTEEYQGNDSYEMIKQSVISTTLCCVYDFFADGRTAVKIYPLYKRSDLGKLMAKAIVPENDRIENLINSCEAFHIGFRSTHQQKLYHFWHPISEESFVNSLNSRIISEVYGKIASCRDRYKLTISLSEDEMVAGKIVNANVYY